MQRDADARHDFDTSDRNRPTLRAGMSVEVDVDTGHRRGVPQFLTALFSPAYGEPVMACGRFGRGNESGESDHRMRDPRHHHAGRLTRPSPTSRCRIFKAAFRLRPRSDQLGADIVYRRCRNHDAAHRFPRRKVRAQTPLPRRCCGASPWRRCCAGWHSHLGADRVDSEPCKACSARRSSRYRNPC